MIGQGPKQLNPFQPHPDSDEEDEEETEEGGELAGQEHVELTTLPRGKENIAERTDILEGQGEEDRALERRDLVLDAGEGEGEGEGEGDGEGEGGGGGAIRIIGGGGGAVPRHSRLWRIVLTQNPALHKHVWHLFVSQIDGPSVVRP